MKYGSFILFRKLEESPLAEIWRAAPIEGTSVGAAVGLLRFTSGETGALRRAAELAAKSLRTIDGSTIVRSQTYHLVGKNPIITWDYAGGRSLFHMMQVAQGGPELPPNPFPVDQSLAIAEKLALSLDTTGHLKHGGQRLHHGILIPQLAWVSEDGEVRTLGHQLTKGLLAALSREPAQQQFGGFVAPELRRNGESTDPSEVWAVGANLYTMLTGEFLPAPTDQKAMDAKLSDAILATDEPMPEPVRQLLAKSLAIDPARRYESPSALRDAISSLTHGGEYAPTTFNLAFYVHNLLREEIEQEAEERRAEKGIDVSLVPSMGAAGEDAEAGPVRDAAPVPTEGTAPVTSSELPSKKTQSNRVPMIAAVVVLLLLIAGGAAAYWLGFIPGLRQEPDSSLADATSAANDVTAPVSRQTPVVESFVATTDTGDAGTVVDDTTATETDQGLSEQELRQKMIQEQIDRRLQEEILKLQAEYDRKLREERQKQQPREEPKQTSPPAPAPAKQASVQQQETQPPSRTVSAAEELDRQRLADREPEAARGATTAEQPSSGPSPAQTPPVTPTTAPAPPPPQIPQVKEGDVIDFAELDNPPAITRRVAPSYPRLAARQKAEATIIVSALTFAIYFVAVGYMLGELGVDLTAYVASASVIGLAVGFGLQGFVQDVVVGLT
ncbi:MAG: hypothetical protein KY432_10455, partial [Acidobacteria bacterium]|nr:hypothetical protein [Acidobacteriota bacterium]